MKRAIIVPLFFLIAAWALFFLIPFFKKPFSAPSEKPLVAASIFPVYDLARNVAGSSIDVELVVPPGGEPHTFEPSPSLIRSLQRAEAVYAIGHGIDDWLHPILSNTQAAEILMDKDIALRPSQAVFADAGAEEEAEGPIDPHYWLTIPNAKKMVLAINQDLQARFPDLAGSFQKNTDAYLLALSDADKELRTMLAPAKGRALITLHDAWYYFADAYGLTIAGTYLPTAGREPSIQYLGALTKAVKSSGAKSLYHEPQFSTQTLESFADDYGLRLVVMDDIGGTLPRDSFIHLMLENAKAIANNP